MDVARTLSMMEEFLQGWCRLRYGEADPVGAGAGRNSVKLNKCRRAQLICKEQSALTH